MRVRERYDHVIVNDDLERALAELRRIAGLGAGTPPPTARTGGAR
jgi:guanylate kinase